MAKAGAQIISDHLKSLSTGNLTQNSIFIENNLDELISKDNTEQSLFHPMTEQQQLCNLVQQSLKEEHFVNESLLDNLLDLKKLNQKISIEMESLVGSGQRSKSLLEI